MSVSNLSPHSLKKIFDCLDRDYPTVAEFSRTNYGVNKIATEHDFLRAKATAVVFTYHERKHTATLRIDIKNVDQERYTGKLVHSIIIDGPGDEISGKAVRRLLSQLEAKVKSSTSLIIVGLTIDDYMLKILQESMLGSIKCLKLYAGHFAIDEKQFSNMLQHLKLETLVIGGTKMGKLKLNTMHMSLVSHKMTVVPFVEHGRLYFPDIGDQLLNNWLYSMPATMNLVKIRTGFTLQAVLKFIKKLCLNNFEKKIFFPLGYVKVEEGFEKEIFLAQRKSKVNWRNYDGLFFQATSVDRNRSVCFYIEKNVSHITKGQARLKIAQLEADILAKIEENPLYNVYADESVSAEIEKLSEAVKKDWKDVKREVARLYSLNEPAFDEDDEDSEDSEED